MDKPYTVISLFCGCGGFDYGFKMTGAFETIWANDNDPICCKTFQRHHPSATVICDDIRKIKKNTIPWGNVILGGSPCQKFSVANNNSDYNDPLCDLVYDYVETVKVVQPDIFVYENVRTFNKMNVFNELVNYELTTDVLNFGDYEGIPQIRHRRIVIGSKIGKINFPPKAEKKRLFPNINKQIHCITATEYKGCATDTRRTSRDLGRRLTLLECMLAQTFPFNYYLAAQKQEDKYRQIGNAVPPQMAYLIALQCKKVLDKFYKSK